MWRRTSALRTVFANSPQLYATRCQAYAIAHHSPSQVSNSAISGENPFFLDVREPVEHKKERIIGTVNVPLSEIKASKEDLSDIPFDSPVYLHCDDGKRAAEAAQYLSKKGFQDLRVVDGGVFELVRDGSFIKERG